MAIQNRVSGLGLQALENSEKLLSKGLQTLFVQVADQNNRSRIVCGVSRICPSITPEQLGKLVEQKAISRYCQMLWMAASAS